MKVVIQKVTSANVSNGYDKHEISRGFVVYVGFTFSDTIETVEKIAAKIIKLRIFEDTNQKMNLNLQQVDGQILLISQFTLYASTIKNNRPSFTSSAPRELALPLYEHMIKKLKEVAYVEHGFFGEYMEINQKNEGPVTIIIDSEELK